MARTLDGGRVKSVRPRVLEADEEHEVVARGGWGLRRTDLSTARLQEALKAHDEALAAHDERVAKHGPKSRVTCHGDLVVKESVPLGWVGRWKDRLAPVRHVAGFANARRLVAAGVPTARPLAWVRREGRVFALYEDLSTLTRLDHLAFERYAAGAPRAAQTRLRDGVAAMLAGLHERGIYHGDLKGCNVLVREDGSGDLGFPLIDVDRVRFFGHVVDPRRRAKNLAQLAASIPVCVTRSERLRFYRHYAAAVGAPRPDEREMAGAVAAALAPKTRVVDRPIE